jgi:hypothetical protein
MHLHYNRARLLFSVMLIVSVPLVFFVVRWYDTTVPVAPVPPGTHLLRREPSHVQDHASSTMRYWYYATYTTSLEARDVEVFYRQQHGQARPFGSISLLRMLPTTSSRVLIPSGQSPSETQFLVEISWTPFDKTIWSPLVFCGFPLVWLIGLCSMILSMLPLQAHGQIGHGNSA